jgi:hypothetical protein
MFHFTKKRAIVIAVVGSLALSVGAYAYFTAAGAGTGSATTGSAATVLITQTNVLPALYPGNHENVSLDIKNTGSGTQRGGAVHLASVATDKTGCDAAAYTMADVDVSAVLAAGATTTRTGSLVMNDTGVDQNTCQGATLTLTFSSNS